MNLGAALGKREVGLFILNDDLKTIQNKMSTIDGGMLNEVTIMGHSPIGNAEIPTIEVKTPNVNINLQ